MQRVGWRENRWFLLERLSVNSWDFKAVATLVEWEVGEGVMTANGPNRGSPHINISGN